MPASYAHLCYGQMVYRKFPAGLREQIRRHPQAFLVGLHGPDLFFFYRPYKVNNKIAAIGHRAHGVPSLPFFQEGRNLLCREYDEETENYLLGFLCHFALDSSCHPYISAYEKEREVRHSEIETELDRALMQRRGKDPLCTDPVAHLRPNFRLAEKIASLFPEAAPVTVYCCMKDFQRYSRLLICRGEKKERLLRHILELGGKKNFIAGMVMGHRRYEGCGESTEVLLEKMKKAVPLGTELAEQFHRCCRDGSPLDERLDRDYK